MPTNPKIWRGSGCILLIDDEDMIRSVTGRMLEYMGFDVLLAASGAEGLALFEEKGEAIDLVILDMSMPVMAGEDVFKALREIREDTMIALSSGGPDRDMQDRATELGATAYIAKPYEAAVLNAQLRVLLGNRD